MDFKSVNLWSWEGLSQEERRVGPLCHPVPELTRQ